VDSLQRARTFQEGSRWYILYNSCCPIPFRLLVLRVQSARSPLSLAGESARATDSARSHLIFRSLPISLGSIARGYTLNQRRHGSSYQVLDAPRANAFSTLLHNQQILQNRLPVDFLLPPSQPLGFKSVQSHSRHFVKPTPNLEHSSTQPGVSAASPAEKYTIDD
jgi:hypothetical protein